MRPVIVLGLISLAACTLEGDEPLASTTQDISRDELANQGYTCTREHPTSSTWYCCRPVEVIGDDGSVWINACTAYECLETPVGSDCRRKQATLDADLNYWFEAEAMTLDGGMQRASHTAASAGSYVHVTGAGSALALFEAAEGRTMTAWVRAIAPAGSSLTLAFDGSGQTFALPAASTWTWLPLDTSLDVDAGTHTLRVRADVGVKIDRLLLTDNPAFVPVVQTREAETASFAPPMQKGTQGKIPTVGYIWVPNGAGTGGLAQLEIVVPYTGNYVVWGRFNAPTESDNSFYIGKLGETRTAWGMATTSSTSWRWDRADISGEPTILHFDGYDVLEIAQREDGTKLDKLVITNDPGFTLVEPAPLVNSQ